MIEEVGYLVLPPEDVRSYVEDACKKQWTERDFPVYGDDLYKSEWKLEEISISAISVDESLLKREKFQQALKPRVEKQQELFKSKIAIPPLILRGSDLRIFDGYARYHFFKELGVKQCLAYVGRRDN